MGKYERAPDVSQLVKVLEDYLVDYNSQAKTKQALALFQYATEHVCRIARILGQPGSHALLVGVGGSGRSSLSRLAAFIMEFSVSTIEAGQGYGQAEWRDDVKRVMLLAGAKGNPVAFLLTDSQLQKDSFLEDINGILNTGEVRLPLLSCCTYLLSHTRPSPSLWMQLSMQVPNLFPSDELAAIFEEVTPRAKKANVALNPKALYDFFVSESRRNLHIVLAFSPIGGAFRERIRTFPALVNCCTFDWFSEWPPEGLRTVARQVLADVCPPLCRHERKRQAYLRCRHIPVNVHMQVEVSSPEVMNGIESLCLEFQQSVTRLSERYKAEAGRHCYTTPTSYLSLLHTFKDVLDSKRSEVLGKKKRCAYDAHRRVVTVCRRARSRLSATGVQVRGRPRETVGCRRRGDGHEERTHRPATCASCHWQRS